MNIQDSILVLFRVAFSHLDDSKSVGTDFRREAQLSLAQLL